MNLKNIKKYSVLVAVSILVFTAIVFPAAAESNPAARMLEGTVSGNYLVENSEQYGMDSALYEQVLFKTELKEFGGSDATLRFAIPDGVTVTAVSFPKFDETYAKYGDVYVSGSLTPLITPDLNGGQKVNLDGLAAGDDVTLKFCDLSFIKFMGSGNAYTKNIDYSVTFYGTTDSSVESGNILTYEIYDLSTNPEQKLCSLKTTVVDDSYVVMYHLRDANYLVNTDTKDPVDSDVVFKPGDTFNMQIKFKRSVYPYQSFISVDKFSNPVVYFSVPAGFDAGTAEYELKGPVEAVKYGFKDMNKKPLAITQRVIMTEGGHSNFGIYGDEGGQLVEVLIRLEEDTDFDETFWINQGFDIIISLPVTVSSDYSGSGMTFDPQSVLLSTWDSNARHAHGQDWTDAKDVSKLFQLNESNGFPTDLIAAGNVKGTVNYGGFHRDAESVSVLIEPAAPVDSSSTGSGSGFGSAHVVDAKTVGSGITPIIPASPESGSSANPGFGAEVGGEYESVQDKKINVWVLILLAVAGIAGVGVYRYKRNRV
ncbi:hypothetical protein LJC08_04695 [Methanimicrococcus sp. OttesenSCG-928-J09]|nr:hypothetical protein [Methanimicrococcus sp. OttesenSCG-928-J09]